MKDVILYDTDKKVSCFGGDLKKIVARPMSIHTDRCVVRGYFTDRGKTSQEFITFGKFDSMIDGINYIESVQKQLEAVGFLILWNIRHTECCVANALKTIRVMRDPQRDAYTVRGYFGDNEYFYLGSKTSEKEANDLRDSIVNTLLQFRTSTVKTKKE